VAAVLHEQADLAELAGERREQPRARAAVQPPAPAEVARHEPARQRVLAEVDAVERARAVLRERPQEVRARHAVRHAGLEDPFRPEGPAERVAEPGEHRVGVVDARRPGVVVKCFHGGREHCLVLPQGRLVEEGADGEAVLAERADELREGERLDARRRVQAVERRLEAEGEPAEHGCRG